jgi:hypothetical protein
MFLLALTATCQLCTVSLKAGQSTYNSSGADAPMVALWHAGAVHGAVAHRGRSATLRMVRS